MTYQLLDSGNEHKFEQFGDYRLVRPCSQAIWKPKLSKWDATATFSREGGNKWKGRLPEEWTVDFGGLKFKILPTDFGHVGLFPEHQQLWSWMQPLLEGKKARVLNLFAYSGAATLAAAVAGAEVCHLDASKGMVAWARENAALNNLTEAPIRWITDDVQKFVDREIRRGRQYEGILLDPPTFGRGSKGELFQIEEHLRPLLHRCKKLLSDQPLFFALSCHTPGLSPIVLENLLGELFPSNLSSGEMVIPGPTPLPCGTYARWHHG